MEIIKAIQEMKLTLTGGYALFGMITIAYFFIYGLVAMYVLVRNMF